MLELRARAHRSRRGGAWVGFAATGLAAAAAVLLLRPRRAAAAAVASSEPERSTAPREPEPAEPTEPSAPPPGSLPVRRLVPAPYSLPASAYGPPDITRGETEADLARRRLHPSADYADGAWFPVRLTEYHPDAPAKERKLEGGKNDRRKVPLITLEQHLADPARFPYVAVASDLILHGAPVAYGTRVYLTLADPRLAAAVFRLVDTGGHFLEPRYPGDPERDKQIRVPGHEPLDVATKWKNGTWKLSGQLTVARIDRSDVLPDPSARRPRAPNA